MINLIEEYLEYEMLHAQVRFHKYRYYKMDDPVIEDLEYDELERDFEAAAARLGFPGSWVDCRDNLPEK